MIITQPALRRSRIAIAAAVTTLLLACGGQSVDPGPSKTTQRLPVPSHAAQSNEDHVIAVALDQIGVPYRYGGNDRSGFDCSGLVQYSFAQAGIGVPRTTGQQWHATQPVPRQDLRPGDLLFFDIEGKMSHVGLYVGDGHFVHAPSTGRLVSIANLRSGYYAKALIRGGRIK